jgi:hypothetical protein
VPSFEPDASLWEPWIPAEVAVAMRAAAVEWAVAGGWAIDLYLRETTREHEDIEIVVAPEDFAAVTRAIDLEWLDVGDGLRVAPRRLPNRPPSDLGPRQDDSPLASRRVSRAEGGRRLDLSTRPPDPARACDSR